MAISINTQATQRAFLGTATDTEFRSFLTIPFLPLPGHDNADKRRFRG